MTCKILKFPVPYIDMGFAENEVNPYLAQGWKIQGVTSADGQLIIVLVK